MCINWYEIFQNMNIGMRSLAYELRFLKITDYNKRHLKKDGG